MVTTAPLPAGPCRQSIATTRANRPNRPIRPSHWRATVTAWSEQLRLIKAEMMARRATPAARLPDPWECP